jgi:hypothetical protein
MSKEVSVLLAHFYIFTLHSLYMSLWLQEIELFDVVISNLSQSEGVPKKV